jgi:hypothetical protein
MTVYVDDMMMQAKVGRVRANARWSHLMADTPEELHEFAQRLGLRREWAQHEDDLPMLHYDVTMTKRKLAIELGAVEITWREAGRRVVALRKAHGSKPKRA